MEPENRLKIRANHKSLVQNVAVSDVQDHLIQFGLLTDEEQDWVTKRDITRREGVRRLLKVVQKKPNSFDKFCDALEEAHDWLADEIRNTDPGTVTAPDIVDGVEEEKMKQLQTQLFLQAEIIQRFKEDVDKLKSVVEVQADENRMIKQRFGELEREMQSQGVSQQDNLKKYLEDYVNKKGHPNRAAIECPDGSSVDAQPQLRRYSMGDPTNLTEAIARHLAVDVVRFMVEGEERSRPPSNRYASVMREMVTEVTTRHQDLFINMINVIQIDEINGIDTLNAIAEELFDCGETNWGRIVTLYAFGGYIARNTAGVNETLSTMIGDFLGFYVTRNLSPWIENAGGWEAFINYFKERRDEVQGEDSNFWRTIIFSVAGVAGIAGIGALVAKR